MPQEDALARALLARTGSLRPGQGTTPASLEAARFAVAKTLSAADADESDRDLVASERLEAARAYFDPEAAASALGGLNLGDRFSFAESSAIDRLFPGGERPESGMVPAQRVGPFVDDIGREIFFEFYKPAAELAVRVPGVGRPALVMGAARRPAVVRGAYRIDLEPGTVWVLARLLDPAAPEDGYVGFRVDDGTVTLPSTPTVAGDDLMLGAPGEMRLELSLAPGEARVAPAACDPGNVSPPTKLDLTVGVAPSIAGVEGDWRSAVGEFSFSASTGVAYDAALTLVAFAAAVEPPALDLAGLGRHVASFSGDLPITSAAWAVPVTRTAEPMDLADADPDAAGWLLRLGGEAEADVPDLSAKVPLAGVSLLVGRRRLLLRSSATWAERPALRRLGLWRIASGAATLPVELRGASPVDFAFACDNVQGEAVLLSCHASFALDRPLTATGVTLPLIDTPASAVVSQLGETRKLGLVARPGGTPPKGLWPLALENGFFRVAAPRFGFMNASVGADGAIEVGSLSLLLEVRGFLPTLPDPYVANVAPNRAFGDSRGGTLIATIDWGGDGSSRLVFRGALAPAGVEPIDGSPTGSRGAADRPQERPQALVTPRAKELGSARRRSEAAAAERAARAIELDREVTELLRKRAAEAGLPLGSGLRLLDVSTRRHQVGVQIASPGGRGAPSAGALSASGMAVVAPLASVQVMMLPQVQWEPVATLDRDQDLVKFGYFPTPLASATDGGATVVASRSLTLAPVVPDLALDGLVKAFAAGERVALATTLPFGIKAVLGLRPGAGGDTLVLNDAAYGGPSGLANALQISLRALGGKTVPGAESPSFAGAAAQLLNGVDLATGVPQGLSVIGSPADPSGSVEAMFNNEFAAAAPRVPLTRLDLSGYGASSFSDWVNPFAAFAEASKVQFQLLVGRTALEIVKFNSVLYPWGIRVTRMVTVERRGGGGVVRRDTGWQPESDGIFDFRYKDKNSGLLKESPFIFHPGVFRGLYRIRNIRPVPNAQPVVFTSSTGQEAELLAYHFDADAVLEDGPGETTTRADGVLGFLHVRPVGIPLTPQDLAGLTGFASAIGGPVDAEVVVGASGLKVRALRVEVDSAGGAVPEFAVAVRGAPVFGTNGSWSVIHQPGPGSATAVPDAEPAADGAPLVREGGVRYFPGTAISDGRMLRPAAPGPYRFADAADLFAAASPARDYGFLQTTPTHAFLYRRPVLAAGDARVTSTLPPLFADVYARATAQSLFPPPANSIELRDRPYVLATNPATGRFRLDPPVSLAAPRPDLPIGDGVEQVMRLVYADTELSLSIGETDWAMDMPRLVIWTGFPDLPELIGTRSRLSGSSAGRSQISEIDTLIADWVDTILSFAPGMNPRERPPAVDLDATNLKLAGKVSAVFFFEREFGLVEFKAFGTVSLGGESAQTPGVGDDFYVGLVIGFNIQGNIPLGGIFFLVLGAELEVGGKVFIGGASAGKGKALMEIKVYVGIGVGTTNPVIKLYGFVAGGLAIERDSSGWHFGGLGMIEAEAMVIELVKVTIGGEFVGIGKREGGQTVTEYTGQVTINVKVMVFLSIKMTWEMTFEQRM